MREQETPDIEVVDIEDNAIVPVGGRGAYLSPKEEKFITAYIETADPGIAAKAAGYSVRGRDQMKSLTKRGRELLKLPKIQNEIMARSEILRTKSIADANEVMEYLTRVMRGEEKDQFGLDASLADRTTAAKELMRRYSELEKVQNENGREEIRLVLTKSWT